jgi:hypothetical protein
VLPKQILVPTELVVDNQTAIDQLARTKCTAQLGQVLVKTGDAAT